MLIATTKLLRKMKLVFLFCVALLLPFLSSAQENPPVSVEFGSEPTRTDSRTSERMHQEAQERAKKMNALFSRVRSVTVEGRWVGSVELPIAVGDPLTPEKISAAMEALRDAINANTLNGYGLRSEGEVGVLYIAVDFDTAPPLGATPSTDKTVGITFRPYYVHVSLVRIGDNVLPIPRSVLPTFYENVPKPLLALKPTFGASYDRAFGTALGGSFETDVLHLADPARSGSSADEGHRLDVRGQGIKSTQEPFYRADGGMRYSWQRHGSTVQEFSVHGDYNGVNEPLGDNRHTRHAGVGGLGVNLKLAPNTRLLLDTGYQGSSDTVDSKIAASNTHTSANEQMSRVLFEAIPRPIEGFLRAAIWQENGWLNGAANNYQRLATRAGYAKEIPLAINQTLGLELLTGGGKLWGGAPTYARFFGGNTGGKFLYDSPSAAALSQLPAGPILRSFGQGEVGLRRRGKGILGGDVYWHANLTLALPVPQLSQSLIPNELTDIDDANGKPTSLKQILRRQIDVTGPSMLAATLANEGLSFSEATRQAESVFQEIQPATHFIIDNANLFAVKPLLMFDAAGMSGSGSSATWLAAGGGIQLTMITAKLEAGYMQTLSGPTFGGRGSAFLRLVFQNLF